MYGISSIAVSATQVGYAVILGGDQPIWLTVTWAIVAFLAGPVTALAVTNTPAPRGCRSGLAGRGQRLTVTPSGTKPPERQTRLDD